ncbi:hypothetical protein N8390_10585 [Amylibacter sp.]|nr:hypothetical protein [Amylibacter sp.]
MTKVFGIGLSKTGTTSLYASLALLGYKTITYRHMAEIGMHSWFRGDFKIDHLDGIDAATDLPVAPFFRELDQAYPGSKFILTKRPIEGWQKSITRQFNQTSQQRHLPSFARDTHLATYGIWGVNEDRLTQVFKDHEIAVRDHFSNRPDDLLVLNFFKNDGWAELCAFLGNEVPDIAFPNVKPGYEVYPDLAERFEL